MMYKVRSQLEATIANVKHFFLHNSEDVLAHKPAENKWSKKEILGHLVDSGINNLQRFTEIGFMPQPYTIRNYRQDELVLANDYQNAETLEILNLYEAINVRILKVISLQTEETLRFEIIMPEGNTTDLRFVMTDYVAHMKHHFNQILG